MSIHGRCLVVYSFQVALYAWLSLVLSSDEDLSPRCGTRPLANVKSYCFDPEKKLFVIDDEADDEDISVISDNLSVYSEDYDTRRQRLQRIFATLSGRKKDKTRRRASF